MMQVGIYFQHYPTTILIAREEIISYFTPTHCDLFDLTTFQLHLAILNLQMACCTNY